MKKLFSSPVFLIILAIVVKAALIAYIAGQAKANPEYQGKFIGPLAMKTNDYSYFIQPVENYFKDDAGVIYYTEASEPFAGRMPGYWFPYFLIRLMLPQVAAINLLIVLQVLLSALSVFFLAKTARIFFKDERAFYFVFFLYLLTPYLLPFDLYTQSESFAVSAFVFHLYFLTKYFYEEQRPATLFCSGFFLAWLIFLRPFTGLAIVFVPLFLLWFFRGEQWKKKIIQLFIFCIPFLVFEISWTARNFIQLKKIVPLETSLEESYGKVYSRPWVQIRQMIVTMGEDAAYFEPGTLSAWFKQEDSIPYSFRGDFFTGVTYTPDSLLSLKEKYHAFMRESDPQKEKQLHDECVNTALRYQQQYASAHVFNVWLKFPAKRFAKFIFSSGSSYVPLPSFSAMSLHQKAFKLYSALMYYFFVTAGFAGMILLLARRFRLKLTLVMTVHLLSIIGLVVFYIDIQENRYLMTVFPCLVLFSFFTFSAFRKKGIKSN
jgi:4-amino-4-deoxy-L-arabinose transferase-like glycosyltransferase